MARGWIEQAIKDDLKTRIKFTKMNRDIINTTVIEEFGKKPKEIIFYRNGARYFISVDGTPVATSLSKIECAKKAFADGHISDTDYVTFTRGYDASVRYSRDKNRKTSLSASERRYVDEILKRVNSTGIPGNVEYR